VRRRQHCRTGHTVAFAAILLSAPHELEIDDRREYGEIRMIATGEIAVRVHVCVYTMRGDGFRIISLRRANRRESDAYREVTLAEAQKR